MPEIIINIILAILSIVGLIYLYQLISGWLLRSKNACRQYTILCIEETMNSAMKHVCRTLEQEYPFVIVCSLNQVHDYITQ